MKLKEYYKKVPGEILFLMLILFLCLYLFGLIVNEVLLESEQNFDRNAAEFIAVHIVNSDLTQIMKVVTFFGSIYFLIAAYLISIIYFFYKRKKIMALNIVVISISNLAVTLGLKELFGRVRPESPLIAPLYNYSFPSGHAGGSFIFFGLLVYLIWKVNLPLFLKLPASVFLILFSLLIGFSRVYLQIHFASDVLAGFILGIFWLILSIWYLEYQKNR
jgi:undecaprenyl-diphosphatase